MAIFFKETPVNVKLVRTSESKGLILWERIDYIHETKTLTGRSTFGYSGRRMIENQNGEKVIGLKAYKTFFLVKQAVDKRIQSLLDNGFTLLP